MTILKSKQLKDWPITELEEFLEEIPVLYRYCDEKDTCIILKNIYYKIVDWINDKRGFTQYRKSFLDRIKKEI